MRKKDMAMDDLDDFLRELSEKAEPMFQIDLATGRVFRRGQHRQEWAVYEEAKKA